MVDVEFLVNAVTLAVVLVVLVFVSIAYYRTRLRGLLVLFLLAALLGVNMGVSLAEEFIEAGVPYLDLLTSLLSLGIALLLLVTIVRRFSWGPG
jgi:hypothetical protein